jgi:hypothetical protein
MKQIKILSLSLAVFIAMLVIINYYETNKQNAGKKPTGSKLPETVILDKDNPIDSVFVFSSDDYKLLKVIVYNNKRYSTKTKPLYAGSA